MAQPHSGRANLAAALRARLDPDHPPHVGVLLSNTPFFSTVLVAAALTGIVPVGLNPTRRGSALRRDIAHADCQLVLADRQNTLDGIATSGRYIPALARTVGRRPFHHVAPTRRGGTS